MRQLSDAARGAKSIKAELAKAFPGIKFSVKSENYSGGNSINVSWYCGPTTKQVDAIIGKYADGSFDGMTDCYDYDRDPKARKFRDEHGSAKYVFANRSFPQGTHERIAADLCKLQRVKYESLNQGNLCGDGDSRYLLNHVNLLLSFTAFPSNEMDYARIVFVSESDQSVERDVQEWCVVEFNTPKAQPAPSAISTNGETRVVHNKEKGGVEIYFANRPSDDVLTRLKSERFRWSRRNRCWYRKYSDDAVKFAQSITGIYA